VLIERDEFGEAEDALEQFVDPRASRSNEAPRFVFLRGRLRHEQGRLRPALGDVLESDRRYAHLRLVGRSVEWRAEAALTGYL
jgi:hypothetical protein